MDNYEIRNGFLYVNGTQVPYYPSPNHGGTIKPRVFVFHDTAGPSLSSAKNWFLNPNAKASAHFVLERDGTLIQMVPTNKSAWHAGKSSWKGVSGVNSFGVGIEIVNPGQLAKSGNVYIPWYKTPYTDTDIAGQGDIREGSIKSYKGYSWSGYWMDYTPIQIEKAIGVCQAVVDAYGIAEENCVTHWMISPGRKVDTNPLFPLDAVVSRAFGRKDSIANETESVLHSTVISDCYFRQWPSYYKSNIIGVLKKGAPYKLNRQGVFLREGDNIKCTATEDEWSNITVDNVDGWVISQALN